MDRRKLVHSFIFSSEAHKLMIETLLLRCAEEENRSISSIIEDAITDYLVVKYSGTYPADKLLELRSAKEKK